MHPLQSAIGILIRGSKRLLGVIQAEEEKKDSLLDVIRQMNSVHQSTGGEHQTIREDATCIILQNAVLSLPLCAPLLQSYHHPAF